MGYVGNQQNEGFSSIPAKQDLTGATGTSLTLTHAVASAEGIDLFINNVRQEPTTAYSVGGDGVTVTLTGSVVASDDIYVVYNSLALQTTVPPDASVSTAKIIDGSVTAAKLAAGVQGVAGITSSSTSGTALSIDANNIVTIPARPAFSVYQSANLTGQDYTSDTKVPFDTKDFDIGNNVTLNSSAVFTAPVDGIYHITCSIMIDAIDSSSYLSLKMFIDDAAVGSENDLSYRYLEDNQGGLYQTGSSSGLIQLTANQTVTPYFRIVDDSSVNFRDGARFFGYLVG